MQRQPFQSRLYKKSPFSARFARVQKETSVNLMQAPKKAAIKRRKTFPSSFEMKIRLQAIEQREAGNAVLGH